MTSDHTISPKKDSSILVGLPLAKRFYEIAIEEYEIKDRENQKTS